MDSCADTTGEELIIRLLILSTGRFVLPGFVRVSGCKALESWVTPGTFPAVLEVEVAAVADLEPLGIEKVGVAVPVVTS